MLTPHAVIDRLLALGHDVLARRWDEAKHLLHDRSEAELGYERPRLAGPLPLVISANEWHTIAQGVIQRARLAEALLDDCFGAQALIHDQTISPATVLGHPGFLRSCHGFRPTGQRRLTVFATDLLRDEQGNWRVVGDHTRNPTGMGFALEHRIVMSRTLPDIYRESQVQRLAGFFITLRRTLQNLASRHRDNPRIVLLSPGSGSPAWFEHAFLARYLGYMLVEGGDLTVRADGLHLKTLGGLHPIDVVLRRLDDEWCDPLELRGDSLLGVPGLVQAARTGHVAIANPLGSGLVDGCYWLEHSATLCRRLLNEQLALNPIATVQAHDLASGHQMLHRPAWPGSTEICRHALPPVTLAPTWRDGSTTDRPVVLRVFSCATPNGWEVMPGGLARIADDGDVSAVIVGRGGSCHDVWVLADGPVEEVSLLAPPGTPVELRRGGADLPSRVADNLFWFGRYCERAEDLCRLLRAALIRFGDISESVGGREALALHRVLARFGHLKSIADQPRDQQLTALVADPDHPTGMVAIIGMLRNAAFAVRDRLSNDTWRAVTFLADDATAGVVHLDTGKAITRIDRLIMCLAALSGMGSENTTRGPGWRFMDLGRRLERAQFTCDLLRYTIAEPQGDDALEAVMEVADSAITYRSRYLTSLQTPAVLDLLLTDASNPRSATFLLAAVEDHVAGLPRVAEQALPTDAERLAVGAYTWLRLVDPIALCRRDETGGLSDLAHVLDHLSSDLDRLSDAITSRYLTHTVPARSLSQVTP